MVFKHTASLIFLSALYVFSSCKKSDSGTGAPPGPVDSRDSVASRDSVMAITSINPVSGRSSTLDTINGTNFSAQDSVYFNGKGASIVSFSATQLIVKVPPQAGTGKVSIIVNNKSVMGPVFTFTGNTYLVSTFAGSGSKSAINGTATAASFSNPTSIAIDRNDNLYVSDYGNNKIRKITPAGVVTTAAGSGIAGSVDGAGSAARFDLPNGVAVDYYGNLYVADYGNHKIRKITSGGAVSTFAGSGIAGSTDATGTAASFSHPSSVALDDNGNVYVGDFGNNKIRKITSAGVVSTFAGSGLSGSGDGKGAAVSFNGLAGIGFDAAGNLYATDVLNNDLRKITPDGTVTTIAGKTASHGYSDGIGLSAVFNGINSVVVDANGFIYVSDLNNEVIRQITPEGAVTLLAGAAGVTGTADGPDLKARFNNPGGLAIDSHGNIFVADEANNLIRKLTPQ